MPRALPDETRRDIEAYLRRGITPAHINTLTGVTVRQIINMRRNLLQYGDIVFPRSVNQGRPRVLAPWQEDRLLEYLQDRPTAYRDEMVWFVYDEFDITIAERTISDVLKRLKWTHKKASHRASQRDQTERDAWRRRLIDWEPEQLIFMDESAAHERTGDRKYAWSPKGVDAGVNTLFKRSKRWSILPAYTINGYIVWKVHHGSITEAIFNDFVRYEVLPLCTPFVAGAPTPNSVLVLDNAKIHKSVELERMCLEAGVELAFLPPYSCDYNPIETSFAVLKQWIKKHGDTARYYGSSEESFERFLEDALQAQAGRTDPGALFRKAGINYRA